MCSAYGIDISVAFTKRLGAGFWGMRDLFCKGFKATVWPLCMPAGAILEIKLSARNRCGLTRVDTGCLLAIQESVYYNIQFVGGIKTAFLGGEGLFFCETNRSRNRLFTDTSFFKAG